jgi:chitinase
MKAIRTLSKLFLAFTLLIGSAVTFVGGTKAEETKYRSVGYYYAQNGSKIENVDFSVITHLNYAFATIYHNETKDGKAADETTDPKKLYNLYLSAEVRSDLRKLREIKKKNPHLKVLLAVGGWGGRGFSDAAQPENRPVFLKSVKYIVDKFDLDGIDYDWEYPVNGGWGAIKSVPEDKVNFTKLLQETRNVIGPDKLLTIATAVNPNYIKTWTEWEKVAVVCDFINIMTYDLAYGSAYHNANLYESKTYTDVLKGDSFTVDQVIQSYLKTGVPAEKFNMGLAFYGRAPKRNFFPAKDWDNGGKDATVPNFDIETFPKGKDEDHAYFFYEFVQDYIHNSNYKAKWDDDAKAPYIAMVDKNGKESFAISYEDERSIGYKTDYIKKHGLGGAMFWSYAGDYKNFLATKVAIDLGINPVRIGKH